MNGGTEPAGRKRPDIAAAAFREVWLPKEELRCCVAGGAMLPVIRGAATFRPDQQRAAPKLALILGRLEQFDTELRGRIASHHAGNHLFRDIRSGEHSHRFMGRRCVMLGIP